MSRHVSRSSVDDYQADEQAGVTQLTGEYQEDVQAGVTLLSWRLSGRRAGRCHSPQLASIKKMSRQVSRGSAGDYQEDEQAGVARLSW